MQASGPTNTSAILSLLIPTSVQRPTASASSVALTGPSAAPPSAAPGTGHASSLPAATASTPATAAPVAPPGTDPKLWSVLTSDEQHFFQQMAALGPLTYGARQNQAPPDAPLGQRIDVRG
jgi:hypothetical protein